MAFYPPRHQAPGQVVEVHAVDYYYQICERFRVEPIAEVTIALRLDYVRHIALPASFRVIDILPLCELLKAEATILSLDLSACEIGDSGCYVLEDMLRSNSTLRAMDLSNNNISFRGAVALANALAVNGSMSWLNLAGNEIGTKGAKALAPIVEQSRCLRYLDVCNNGLRVKGVLCLHDALTRRMRHKKARKELSRPRRAGNGLPFLGQKGGPAPVSASVAPRASDPAYGSDGAGQQEGQPQRRSQRSSAGSSSGRGEAPARTTRPHENEHREGDDDDEEEDEEDADGRSDPELEFEVDEEGARLMEAGDGEWMRAQGHRDAITPLPRPPSLPELPAVGGSGSGGGSSGRADSSSEVEETGAGAWAREQPQQGSERGASHGGRNRGGNAARPHPLRVGQGTADGAPPGLPGSVRTESSGGSSATPREGAIDDGVNGRSSSAAAGPGQGGGPPDVGLAESILPGDHPDLRADELWAIGQRGQSRDGIDVRWGGNFVQEEVLNSIIHGVGFVLALAGGIPLLQRAHASGDQAYLGGAAVYLVGLLVFYLAATLRHSFFLLRSTSRMFHVIDHSAIFVLIAGTYTPFVLVNMRHLLVGRAVLVAAWIFSFVGLYISVSCARKGPWPTVKRLLYLAMGWLGLVATPWVRVCVDPMGVVLLVAGGIIYSAGAVAYITQRRAPPYSARRSVWYLLVLLASMLHYVAVFAYVGTHGNCAPDWVDAANPWAWLPVPDLRSLAGLLLRGPAWLAGFPLHPDHVQDEAAGAVAGGIGGGGSSVGLEHAGGDL